MRALRTLRNEEGMALVMALGVMFVLTISALAVIQFSGANSRSASYNRSNQDATSLAESGVNFARSVLWQASDPTLATAVPAGSTTIDGKTVSWSGSYNAASGIWTLTGTATRTNPANGTSITRRVVQQVNVTSNTFADTAKNEVWRYLYADSTTGCNRFADNAVVSASIYVRGNLCLDNNAAITGERVQVMGSLTVGSNAKVGDPGKPIEEIHVNNGCGGNPCSTADRVYAKRSDTTPALLTKPEIDLAGWYANAAPGPTRGCTSGSFPGGFDNDGVLNRSRGTVSLTAASAYDCQVRNASGALIGRIAWNPATSLLTVLGTMLFDGNLSVNSGTTIVYSGRATIYTSGNMVFNDNARVCGVAACDSTWNPTTNLIAFIAGGSDWYGTSIAVRDGARVQGAFYAADNYVGADNTHVFGPIIADRLTVPDNARNYEVAMGPPLDGMPQFTVTTYTLTNVSGSNRIS